MFSTKEYLQRKTGPYGIGRLSYLQSLVTEFQDSDDIALHPWCMLESPTDYQKEGYTIAAFQVHGSKYVEGKQQVIANLANFAYDPINYEFFRQLNILDLFLDGLEENDEKIVEYAIGGLCNACLDKENKDHIISNGGVKLVIKCLSRPTEETVLSAMTTLMYLVTPESKHEITSTPVVECVLRFSKSKNKRLCNLAEVFLQDFCSGEQIQAAKDIQNKMMKLPT